MATVPLPASSTSAIGVSRRQIAVYRRTSEVALDDVLGVELEQAEIEVTGKDDGPIATLRIIAADPVEASRQYQRLIRGIAP